MPIVIHHHASLMSSSPAVQTINSFQPPPVVTHLITVCSKQAFDYDTQYICTLDHGAHYTITSHCIAQSLKSAADIFKRDAAQRVLDLVSNMFYTISGKPVCALPSLLAELPI
eukprot:1160675-Pelagomonas_calceolata.AAC.24